MDNPPKGIVPATSALARALAANLSDDHLREIDGTAGMSPEMAILLSLAVSVEAYAFVPDGNVPVFMMGVEATGSITGSAMLWMLATDAIRRHPAGTLRVARWGLRRAFAVGGSERLEQYIPEWYGTGLRFTRRLGFRDGPTPCRDRHGSPLRHVVLERKEATTWAP